MKSEIYGVLNHVDTNFEEYKEITFTDFEHKRNTRRILSKINGKYHKNKSKTWNLPRKLVVASFIAIIGLASATTLSLASEGKYLDYLYTFLNGSGITSEYDDETGIVRSTVVLNATENPPVKLFEGKLYFIVNGSQLDITQLISDSTPYISEYVDDQKVVHKFIIGGTPKDNCYGYEENLFSGDGTFLGSSGYFGSKVAGMEDDKVPEWLVSGRKIIGRDLY